ncbi:uncharacterized protein VTP21DRAFT_9944 [Calcarisporiella thermophila]|uniref:uncharacterized protein n=1 Tax=Calcarisporiella thermophila TaxID=911321 RepID=UPI00374483F3
MISEKRTLGNTNEKMSAIGLGCMTMSLVYSKEVDEEQSVKTLHRALDLGINFLGYCKWVHRNPYRGTSLTLLLVAISDVYGMGHNEGLVSQVLKQRRNEVFLCTKFGLIFDIQKQQLGVCSKPETVRKACQESLERLGTDYIDLYYLHRVDPSVPIEETVGTMAQLVKEGKVRYLGLSECSPDTLRRAHKVHSIDALRGQLLSRKMACWTHSPSDLDPNDRRFTQPWFQGENFQNNLKLAEKLQEMANKKNCTPARLCIAWALAQDNLIIPIPGTRRIARLEENSGAVNVKLNRPELNEIST